MADIPSRGGDYAIGRQARSTMSLAEIAQELGHDAEWLSRKDKAGRRRWQALIEGHGMPGPIHNLGHPRFDRSSFMAWKQRHHPARPAAAANDRAAAPPPASDLEHRAHLQTVYGGKNG